MRKKEIFVIRYNWLVIALTLIIVGAALIPLLRTEINPDLKSYMPSTMPASINNDKIEEVFGIDEMLILLFESEDVLNENTLKRIRSLSKEFNRMDDFSMVMSLFDTKDIRGEAGAMIVDPAVKRIPRSYDDRELLRASLKNNELANGLVVSDDFRHTAIILNCDSQKDDEQLLTEVINILEEYPGDEVVSMFGMPYMRYEANRDIAKDIGFLLPLGLLVIILYLIFSFRQVRGALMPFTVVIFSIIISMAVIPFMGWQLSIIGILIPVMMISITNNYGVYFVSRYQELNTSHPDWSMKDIVRDSVNFLKRPIVFCGLTTIAGVGGIITHIMIPAKQVGIAASIGIGFGLLLSLTFIPAVMSLLKKGKQVKSAACDKDTFFMRTMRGVAGFITGKPKWVIAGFIIFMLFCIAGLTRFRISVDNNGLFPKHHQYTRALNVIDKSLGGTKTISIMFEGDIKDPSLLKNMDHYGQELEKMPEVGHVNSIAKVIRIMSRALNDPTEENYNTIPDTRDAVAQYLELYSMSGDPEDFSDLVDFDYTCALMVVQYSADNMKTLNGVEDKIRSMVKDDLNVSVIGGYSLFEKELSQSMADSQVTSLLVAFVLIILLVIFIFRSGVAGFMGSLPLLFTVVSIFGLMGWLGLELNIVSALLSSVSIGLGVDFSIQLFWRLKSELNTGKTYQEAIKTSLTTIGRGIIITATSVMFGFAVLLFSEFPYIREFGGLIVLSVFLCLAGALIMIPALCILIKPKFLKK